MAMTPRALYGERLLRLTICIWHGHGKGCSYISCTINLPHLLSVTTTQTHLQLGIRKQFIGNIFLCFFWNLKNFPLIFFPLIKLSQSMSAKQGRDYFACIVVWRFGAPSRGHMQWQPDWTESPGLYGWRSVCRQHLKTQPGIPVLWWLVISYQVYNDNRDLRD